MSQLLLNRIDHERPLPSVEATQVLQCYWRIDDLIGQAQVSFIATSPSVEAMARSSSMIDRRRTGINPHATPGAEARGGG